MITRPYWLDRITHLWTQESIIWLSGVRRVGKTSLCRQIPGGRYFNCDLPSVQRQMADPEFFLAQQSRETPLLLDEVHRIADPAIALKIAADEYPHLRILATGSSTLQATGKFMDSLTDRKRSLHLLPVLWRECLDAFGQPDLDQRLLHGGLPGVLLGAQPDPATFEDWMDEDRTNKLHFCPGGGGQECRIMVSYVNISGGGSAWREPGGRVWGAI
jgi:predicted AAA+ superfamily ATPase